MATVFCRCFPIGRSASAADNIYNNKRAFVLFLFGPLVTRSRREGSASSELLYLREMSAFIVEAVSMPPGGLHGGAHTAFTLGALLPMPCAEPAGCPEHVGGC